MKRTALVAMSVAAVAVAPLLTGCTGGADESTTTIVWSTWGNPEAIQEHKDFAANFMKSHPDIKVVYQPVAGYSDYNSKLVAQLASGTAPDVFYVGDDQIGKMVDSDVLLPLNELMASPASESPLEDFAPGLIGAAQKGDQIYAMPNDSNPDALWYDKKALAAAGITEDPATLAAEGKWTTDVYLDMNAKLAQAGLTGSMFWNYWATHWSWISSQGGTIFDGEKFVADSDPTSVDALQQFAERFQDGTFVVADNLPEGSGADSLFVQHKAGFFIQGRYTIGTVRSAGDPESYDVAPWPTPDGTAAPTGVAVSYLAINKNTKHQDAAFAFWTAYLSAAGQKERLGNGGAAVPSIVGADDVVLADNYPAHAQTLLDMKDLGFVDPAPEARVPGLSGEVSELMLKLYEGKSTARETLDAAAALIAQRTSGQ